MMRIVAAIFGTLLLTACSSKPVMEEVMSSWVGEDIDSVIDQWGYPDEQREVNGRKLYVWHERSSVRLRETTSTTGSVDEYGNFEARSTTKGGGTWKGYCGRLFEVDSEGTVVKWEWKGNDCPFIRGSEYDGWRNDNEK